MVSAPVLLSKRWYAWEIDWYNKSKTTPYMNLYTDEKGQNCNQSILGVAGHILLKLVNQLLANL
jgi:hypothetical protein